MTLMVPSAEEMSGNHWCPAGWGSIGMAGPKVVPLEELRTYTRDWPAASSDAHTTWTPVASASTAELLKKRENVKPVEQSNGASPQSYVPASPLYWLESNRSMAAICRARVNVWPPSVDRESRTAPVNEEVYRNQVMYSVPVGPTARSTNEAVPCSVGVTFTGAWNETPWLVERDTSTLLLPDWPLYWDQPMYTLSSKGLLGPWSTARLSLSWKCPDAAKSADGVPFLIRTVRS